MGKLKAFFIIALFGGLVSVWGETIGYIIKAKGEVEVLRTVQVDKNTTEEKSFPVKVEEFEAKVLEDAKSKVALQAVIDAQMVLNDKNASEESVQKAKAFLAEEEIAKALEVVEKAKGFALLKKDKVNTKEKSRAAMEFNDKTVINLGAKSKFEIYDYLYSEKEKEKTIGSFGIPIGTFKAITGGIGKLNPDKFKVKARTATIGIRGTEFIGVITEASEKIACTKGAITATAAGATVVVPVGLLTEIASGMAPSVPRAFTAAELGAMVASMGLGAIGALMPDLGGGEEKPEEPAPVPVPAQENNQTVIPAPVKAEPKAKEPETEKIYKYWE